MNEKKPGLPAHSIAIGNKERTKQAKHTPGPWVARGERIVAHRQMAGQVHNYNEESIFALSRPPDERLANAKLIAAAPALADALAAFVKGASDVSNDQYRAALSALRAAGRLP